MKFGRFLWAALAALAIAAPFTGIYPVFLMKVMCFALFASAYDLLLGFGGLLSLGHAAFFGFAAYITAHALKVWGLSPELGLILGAATAGLLGLAFGWISIRRSGIYFAMISLALAEMVFFVCVQAPFTHGEDGIQAVPRGMLFGIVDLKDPTAMYFAVLGIYVGGLLLIRRVIKSPFGHVLRAIRDNEDRAVSLGYDVSRYKLTAFGLSATLSGGAGATKAIVFQLATLTDVHWHASGEVLLMALLGGSGTLIGPSIGAFIVVGIQSLGADAGSWVTIIQGVVFIIIVTVFRKGIVGEVRAIARWVKRWRHRNDERACCADAGGRN